MNRLVAALVVCSLTAGCSGGDSETGSMKTPSASQTTPSTRPISGLVVLDGSVNGCGGEQITVQIRDAAGVIGSALEDSAVIGFDCTFRFRVDVPIQECYSLFIDSNPVGRYPDEALDDDGDIGVITSNSVWGDPEAAEDARPNADFNGC